MICQNSNSSAILWTFYILWGSVRGILFFMISFRLFLLHLYNSPECTYCSEIWMLATFMNQALSFICVSIVLYSSRTSSSDDLISYQQGTNMLLIVINVFTFALSNLKATCHKWLFKFKFTNIKEKARYSVLLARFQILNSYM